MCRDQHFTFLVNKQTTFSCLQDAEVLPDYVFFYAPAHLTYNTTHEDSVHPLNHFAAAHALISRVRILEIYLSNNEVDVIANLSGQFHQQKCGNYSCGNRITTPNAPQVFNNPTHTMVFFAIVIHN